MTEAVTVAPKDTSNLTRWTIWLLYAEIGISVVAIFSNYLEYQFLENIRNGLYAGNQPQAEADGATSDSRQMVIGITEIVLAVLTGIIILRWIYFANKNLRSLGASGLRFSPGWAIGWYFVPVFNLWKPYQAMKEVWQASTAPLDWHGKPVSPYLPWWWAAWIAASMVGNLSFKLSIKADSLDGFVTANIVNQTSEALSIILCAIFVKIVKEIHAMQSSNPMVQRVFE